MLLHFNGFSFPCAFSRIANTFFPLAHSLKTKQGSKEDLYLYMAILTIADWKLVSANGVNFISCVLKSFCHSIGSVPISQEVFLF